MTDLLDPAACKPADNFLLVAVPERFVQRHPPGQRRLILPSGSDDWAQLTADLKVGRSSQIETDETFAPIPVSVGMVLAIPRTYSASVILCAAPGTKLRPRLRGITNEKGERVKNRDGSSAFCTDGYSEVPNVRTGFDINDWVRVGEQVHFDKTALTDEAEVFPGVYLISIAYIIAITQYNINHVFEKNPAPQPVGGYALLTQVWPEDTEYAQVDGEWMHARFAAERDPAGNRIVVEQHVRPLANEGRVAYLSVALGYTMWEIKQGDLVIFRAGMALTETINGTEYLCVRQDFIEAKRVPELRIKAAGQERTAYKRDWASDFRRKPFERIVLDLKKIA